MSDLARFTDDPQLKTMISHLLAVLGGATTAPEPQEGERFYGDGEVMVEALAFLGALLVEGDPGASTNQLLRRSADEIARRTTLYAKAIRADNERTGEPLIARFVDAPEVIPKAGGSDLN